MKKMQEVNDITLYKKEITTALTRAESITIKKQEDMEQATTLLSLLNQQNDRIEEEKEKVIKPLNEALKAERARWKPIETELATAITIVRTKLSEFQTLQIKTQREEEAKIASRVAPGKGNLTLETAVKKMEALPQVTKKVATDAGLVKFREDTILKITNPQTIPNSYFIRTLDEKRLLADLKAGTTVPGAELDIVMVPLNYR
jgi:hypothetical protein